MTSLLYILAATLAGGVLSVAAAAVLALNAREHHVPLLVSYAVGALLGAAFLDILPEAFRTGSSIENTAGLVLLGLLLFFTLEKFALWRHCHDGHCEAHEAHAADHDHDHGRSGIMLIIGDNMHNFTDGVVIAAAFLTDTRVGIVTAIAIIAHEIPHEIGNFLVLLHSGYSRTRALLFNLLSSLSMVAGGVLAWAGLQALDSWVPALLALAAASMLYVAVADLIPGLHKRPQLRDSVQQIALIAAGVATIWAVSHLEH